MVVSAQRLETLDLSWNTLGQSGIMMLFEALKQNNGPLKILRLEMDESSMEVQKLLKDVKDSNPNLTIERSDARTTRSPRCDFVFNTLRSFLMTTCLNGGDLRALRPTMNEDQRVKC